MSDATRIALVGATGLIGRAVMEACIGREDVRLAAIARREVPLPRGARMELFVADPDKWGEVIEALRPRAMICALGTTWKKAGETEAGFRAVDQDLVMQVAQAAHDRGVERFVLVSAGGADAHSSNFYLKVKGEVERDLRKIGFGRLDVLRPGLLRGERDNDRRLAERLGIAFAPVANLFLHGRHRRLRAIDDCTVARAAIAFAKRAARGRFAHEYDAIVKAAASLPPVSETDD